MSLTSAIEALRENDSPFLLEKQFLEHASFLARIREQLPDAEVTPNSYNIPMDVRRASILTEYEVEADMRFSFLIPPR
ncbi:MAG: hypothetical protein HZA67_09210 [Rhodospirillales bacterium]|nr:hypothetical protein [Rhodospirillales bacterium]